MIDVIIPAYNAHSTIETTLFSIAYQDIVDKLNVFIVNDCSEKDYSDSVKFFSNFMNIKELKLKKNSGPGAARQYGIENSNGDYIIFIDSDDAFASPFSVKKLYEEISRNDFDIVNSSILLETDTGFEPINHVHLLHGKIYKRKFLEKNNIYFSEYRYCEDVFFNYLLLLYKPNSIFLAENTYIWRNNKNSLTRKSHTEFSKDNFKDYIENITLVMEEGIKRKCSNNMIAFYSYLLLVNEYYWYLENPNDKLINPMLRYMKKINKIYEEYKKYLNLGVIEELSKCINMENQYDKFSGIYIQSISFDEFRNKIEELGDL